MSDIKKCLLVYGSPIFVGLLNSWHPIVAPPIFPKISEHLHWWLHLHLLNLIGFALIGYATYVLVSQAENVFATISKITALLFIPLYCGFDALAGIGTGILSVISFHLSAEQATVLRSVIDILWNNDLLMALAVIGSIFWTISMLTAALAFTDSSRRWMAVVAAIVVFCLTGWARSNIFFAADNITITHNWWFVTAGAGVLMLLVCKPSIPGGFFTLAGVLFGASHVVPTGPLGMLCFLIGAISVRPRSK